MIARLIKLAVSAALCVLDRVRQFVQGPRAPATSVVLYYHAVRPDQRARFAAQMDRLLEVAEPISAAHDRPLAPGRRYAAVTFDDGFVSVLEQAIPELTARKIPSTVFVPTGSLGRAPAWVKQREHPSASESVVRSEQLKQLAAAERVTVGSHSVTHPRLSALPENAVREELQQSRAELEKIIERPVDLFSFPHGAHNERVLQLAREAGYKRVFTISPTLAFVEPREFVTGRVAADPADWGCEFTCKTLGGYRWLSKTRTMKSLFKRAGKTSQ